MDEIEKCLGPNCPTLLDIEDDLVNDIGPQFAYEVYIATNQGECPKLGQCALALAEKEAANA